MKNKFIELFNSYNWQWWVTLTFASPVLTHTAHKKLKEWTRAVAKGEGLQVAYYAVLSKVERLHIHLLMSGKNRHGQTLLDADSRKCERMWKNGLSRIVEVWDNEGVCKYFVKNMSSDHELIP